MDGCVDQHAAIMHGIPRMSTAVDRLPCAVERRRAFSRVRHNAGMQDKPSFRVSDALHRALQANKRLLKSMNHWGVRAGLPQTTVRDAFNPERNPTIDTLTRLAAAADMTVAELMEYGDPDWEVRVKARQAFRGWTAQELTDLAHLLERRTAPDDAA